MHGIRSRATAGNDEEGPFCSRIETHFAVESGT